VIQRQSHSTIYVTDQDEALEFYRDKLGFEVRADMPMSETGGPRWLTLNPKGQPDLEVILMPIIAGPMFDARTAEEMKALVEKGAFGVGVFQTDDLHGDHKRLSDRGVEFLSPPTERFYGLEAVVKDSSAGF
jgi:catechol 2,3-dioxygenase-like lactoylglutathione lyase family enzyme